MSEQRDEEEIRDLKLTVVVTPSGDGPSVTRAGHTLSVLKKHQGKWVLARDANMLAPVSA